MAEKNRYWSGVLYPENMVDDWQDLIGDLLQLPYCYCIHHADLDSKSEHRKDHVHLIIVFNNTTTYKHALSVFNVLSSEGRIAINTCKPIINIRSMYEYLIHNTETCRKLGKEEYAASERIAGNNFDIGNYEQVSLAEKNEVCKELCKLIVSENFIYFNEFFMYVCSNYEDGVYFDVLKSHSGLMERIIKGNYYTHKDTFH